MMSIPGLEPLREMDYPGRVIIIGRDTRDEKDLIVYAVTGRSPASRARELVRDGSDTVKTHVTDPKQLSAGNERLLIYNCFRRFRGGMAVSNGAQTDLIAQTAEELTDRGAVPAPAEILRRTFARPHLVDGIDLTSYEPDRPAFTPRISGCITAGAALSITRRAGDGSAARDYFEVPLRPGRGKLLATYAGENVDPLPAFGGQPIEVEIESQTAQELAETVYHALGPRDTDKDLRVGVAAVLRKWKSKEMSVFILNRPAGER